MGCEASLALKDLSMLEELQQLEEDFRPLNDKVRELQEYL
jgi:hypothetical protein